MPCPNCGQEMDVIFTHIYEGYVCHCGRCGTVVVNNGPDDEDVLVPDLAFEKYE